jgi:hypothetical protein
MDEPSGMQITRQKEPQKGGKKKRSSGPKTKVSGLEREERE